MAFKLKKNWDVPGTLIPAGTEGTYMVYNANVSLECETGKIQIPLTTIQLHPDWFESTAPVRWSDDDLILLAEEIRSHRELEFYDIQEIVKEFINKRYA